MDEKPTLIRKQKRKKMVRVVRHTLSHAVLVSLSLAGGVMLATAPGLGKIIQQLQGNHSATAAARTLERLYRRGFVTLSGSRGARKAMLTDAGKRYAHFLSVQTPHVQTKWDKTWFMVSFDIPTEQLAARDGLRHKLKDIGFVEYQKSLYVYPYGCESELDFLVDYFGVKKHVKYFYAADLPDDASLRKRFKL